MATAMTATPAWEVWGATVPKWKTWWVFPRGLEASQETPSWLKALVTFRVRELLTQPWPPGAGSVGLPPNWLQVSLGFG